MKIVNKRIYEGKNIYSHKKCIRIDVDLEGYAEIPSKNIPNFNFNIVEILPELRTHRCGIDEDEGFVKRLKEGTYLAHICEHCIIAIQNTLGMDVSYGCLPSMFFGTWRKEIYSSHITTWHLSFYHHVTEQTVATVMGCRED